MASYPSSIKSFTTKVDNVDDVMAADVNDLQAEVVAIETALGVGCTNPVVQVVNVTTTSRATGTTVLPFDDTIPQNSEGDEYMTLAITPKSTTNKLKIDVKIILSHITASNYIGAALFQDSTAGALAAVGHQLTGSGTVPNELSFTHYMTSGTTSATTFKVRGGSQIAGTTELNSLSGARLFGGVCSSSITITEIKA